MFAKYQNNQKLDLSSRPLTIRLSHHKYEITPDMVSDIATLVNKMVVMNNGEWLTNSNTLLEEAGVPQELISEWKTTYEQALYDAKQQGLVQWKKAGPLGRRFY